MKPSNLKLNRLKPKQIRFIVFIIFTYIHGNLVPEFSAWLASEDVGPKKIGMRLCFPDSKAHGMGWFTLPKVGLPPAVCGLTFVARSETVIVWLLFHSAVTSWAFCCHMGSPPKCTGTRYDIGAIRTYADSHIFPGVCRVNE